MIAIIDYGAGNLRSVVNAVVRLGCMPKVTSEPGEVLDAAVAIFPGVGAAPEAMCRLRESGLDDAVERAIAQGKPFLAICVGMQVLLSSTEEGGWHEGLGIIPGAVKRLPPGLKVPHMGWNQVKQRMSHPIFEGIPDGANFYFVHSYYPAPEDSSVVAGTTEYGTEMCSILVKEKLVATQFHPEKSGEIGLRLFRNFLKIAGVKG